MNDFLAESKTFDYLALFISTSALRLPCNLYLASRSCQQSSLENCELAYIDTIHTYVPSYMRTRVTRLLSSGKPRHEDCSEANITAL